MNNPDYFFYGNTFDSSDEIESLVAFIIGRRKIRRSVSNIKKFSYIDIEYRKEYLITFKPGEHTILKRSLKYDKNLYNYLVKRLMELTGWSKLIIQSYFIYE